MNMSTDADAFERSTRIQLCKDKFDPIRNEYSQMLRSQLDRGNNGLTKTKYITFGIEAESMKQDKPRLEHVQTDLLNNFRRLGASAQVLNGRERLQVMHDMFHMGDNDKFFFDWEWLPGSGLSVKDFIAPTSFSFPGGRTFTMGPLYGAMSFLSITASDISDQLLKDFLEMESSQIISMHIQSVDQTEASKQIKHTITELDRSKIEEQKKAVRSGYDMDINSNYSEDDDPTSLKAEFILSLCELVVGGKEGLLPVEKTVIDRCVHKIYRRYFENPIPENMPILEDLYNALHKYSSK